MTCRSGHAVYLHELVTERLLEVLERQQDDGDVVEGLVGYRRLHHLLHYVATGLVDWLVLRMEVLLCGDPTLLEHLCIADLVKNTIAYQKYKLD